LLLSNKIQGALLFFHVQEYTAHMEDFYIRPTNKSRRPSAAVQQQYEVSELGLLTTRGV
jgi:hypothetical protein